MKRFFPVMYDRPAPGAIFGALGYGIWSFIIFPFLLRAFAIGLTDQVTLSWFDVVLHGVNLIVAVFIFREYLVESFFNVRYYLKQFLGVSCVCAAVCIIYGIVITLQGMRGSEDVYRYIAQGALPVAEAELFNVSVNLICLNPIGGSICLVLMAPLSISCLYYAAAFAPICSRRPWLAYIVVAVMLAVPRACNIFNLGEPWIELVLYLVQLPLHWIACLAYQKTDTVWAPVAIHMMANAAACAAVITQLGVV